ncbi:lipopolysaccharide-induced tumor necrosis factor-alpha factor isoform X5 [Trachypithecus francoisi]|uniref:lipopolysaccharide-induced tumor necrosis factor-alpha factor isoform X5 n=1 Tax=Trachypithecus francoisi TaxID=54180 RepID=UPI00141AD06F|nr:lipopolysaccharide-induced tumor necrosis factor-alpha factor isoform X5 [Trachypithecus francoisi]
MSDFPAECLPQSPQCPADRASLPALSLLSLPHLMPVKLPLLLRSWVPAQHFELQQGSWGCLSLAQLGSHALITGAITEAQEMLGSDWPALVMCMTQSLGPGRRDASAAKSSRRCTGSRVGGTPGLMGVSEDRARPAWRLPH